LINKLLVVGAIAASALLIAPGAASAATPTVGASAGVMTDQPFHCLGSSSNSCPKKEEKKTKKAEPEPVSKSDGDKCDTADFAHPQTTHFGHPWPEVTNPAPAIGHALCEVGKNIPK
jgi:hypothetical protein